MGLKTEGLWGLGAEIYLQGRVEGVKDRGVIAVFILYICKYFLSFKSKIN